MEEKTTSSAVITAPEEARYNINGERNCLCCVEQTIHSAVQWVGVLCLDANCNVQIFPLAS